MNKQKGENLRLHLLRQRMLEIERAGVKLIFYKMQGYANSYFQFDYHSRQKMLDIINNGKFGVEICSSDHQIVRNKVDTQQFYLDQQYPYYLFLKGKRYVHYFQQQSYYFIVRANTTLSILTDVCKMIHKVSPNIFPFINEQTIYTQPNPLSINSQAIQDLNPSQQQAISKSLKNPITFIRGPPGCGKTKTIARICSVFCELGKNVLVGGTSNTSLQSITREIVNDFTEQKINKIQITLFLYRETHADNNLHPFEVRKLTLRYKILQVVRETIKNIQMSEKTFNDYLDSHWTDRRYQPPSIFYAIYKQAQSYVLSCTQLLIANTITAYKIYNKSQSNEKNFQYKPYIGVLDEAAQSSWADSLCFLIQGLQKIIFVGDDKQLTPTVISGDVVLKQTMFSLINKNQQYYTLLNTQYRMHPLIAQFPNKEFYNGLLKNGVTEEDRKSEIKYFEHLPVSFITHANIQTTTVQINPVYGTPNGRKKYSNTIQVQIIGQMLSLFSNFDFNTLGIITPYDDQLRLIKQNYNDYIKRGLTVKTCDGYQGGQKDYIIVSCVRSNDDGKLGFCKEENRMNVTLTRAKKGLVIIGNAQSLQKSEAQCWKKYIKYLQSNKLIYDRSIIQHYLHNKIIDRPIRPIINQQTKIDKKIKQQPKKNKKNSQQQKLNKIHKYLDNMNEQWKELQNSQNNQDEQHQKFYSKKINKKQRTKISRIISDYRLQLIKKNITQLTAKQYRQQFIEKLHNIVNSKWDNNLERMIQPIYQMVVQYIKDKNKTLEDIKLEINNKINQIQSLRQLNFILESKLIYQLLKLKIVNDQVTKARQQLGLI